MLRKSGLYGLFLLLFTSSCVSYQKFTIEVFKPSYVRLPSDTRQVAIVSRNLKYTSDTLQNYFLSNRRLVHDKNRFNVDSMAIAVCLDTLANILQTRENIDSIRLVPVQQFPRLRISEVRPAKMEWYQNLAEKYRSDVLILLDMFSCFYSTEDADGNPEAKVVTSNIWSVYNAKNKRIIDRFTQIDTLYWNQSDEDGNFRKMKIPDKRSAVLLSAGVIGENYSRHILPSWTKVERSFLVCRNEKFEKAIKLAQNNQWNEAVIIWETFVNSKNKAQRVSSLYNLALASEMNGDIDKALNLIKQGAEKSSGIFMGTANELVRRYAAVLFQRKLEITKLNQQNEAH